MSDTNNDIHNNLIGERLRELRKALGLTQKEFADKLGMVPPAIGMMERGTRKINKRQTKAICSIYNANEDWLVNGNGEMFVNSEENNVLASNINDRLYILRNKLGLSRKAFGERIGVSLDVIKNFDYKHTTPKNLQIDLICKEYNINKTWLETGEGEIFEGSTEIDRIKTLRKSLGLSQTEFGEKLGLSRDSVNNIENKGVPLTQPILKLIGHEYNVNLDWLETGNGEMFVEHFENAEYFIRYIYSSKSNSFKKRFIAMLAALDDDGWLLLQKMAESLVEHKDDEEK